MGARRLPLLSAACALLALALVLAGDPVSGGRDGTASMSGIAALLIGFRFLTPALRCREGPCAAGNPRLSWAALPEAGP